MTKTEQIKMLELELESTKNKLESAEREVRQWEKTQSFCCKVEETGIDYDPVTRMTTIRVEAHMIPSKYATAFGDKEFCKAFAGFLEKWNIDAIESSGIAVKKPNPKGVGNA